MRREHNNRPHGLSLLDSNLHAANLLGFRGAYSVACVVALSTDLSGVAKRRLACKKMPCCVQAGTACSARKLGRLPLKLLWDRSNTCCNAWPVLRYSGVCTAHKKTSSAKLIPVLIQRCAQDPNEDLGPRIRVWKRYKLSFKFYRAMELRGSGARAATEPPPAISRLLACTRPWHVQGPQEV